MCVNLVIDNCFYVASGTSPLYNIWKQSDYYLWRYGILKIRVSFGCEGSCSNPRRVSNFNSNVPQGGIYPHIKLERGPWNLFWVRVITLSGSTGGGGRGGADAKTIISPNTSFGDIIWGCVSLNAYRESKLKLIYSGQTVNCTHGKCCH